MENKEYKRIPKHVAIIPDGNRRWAQARGLEKHEGYSYGIKPGVDAYKLCKDLGIEEFTFFGFTKDNTKRPQIQIDNFTDVCIKSVEELSKLDAELRVFGDDDSNKFPDELRKYLTRANFGKGGARVNFLVNYGWYWDLAKAYRNSENNGDFTQNIASADIPRVDLVIRWGGRHRLSGILPIQTVYADTYIIDDMWPDFKPEHIYNALDWYQTQDITLGG